jgi:AcrR family transcriptional regulator
MSPRADPKQALLDAAIEHVAAHGISDTSLRSLAAALGTSHRMLIYHFGSKEGLLVEVVRSMEAQQRAVFDEMLPLADISPAQFARDFWRKVTEPEMWPRERLFFEMYGQALQGRPGTVGLLDGIVASWVDPMTEWGQRAGLPVEVARTWARLGIAVPRGLLLDLLATGDRAAVDEAMEAFIASYEAVLAAAGRLPP